MTASTLEKNFSSALTASGSAWTLDLQPLASEAKPLYQHIEIRGTRGRSGRDAGAGKWRAHYDGFERADGSLMRRSPLAATVCLMPLLHAFGLWRALTTPRIFGVPALDAGRSATAVGQIVARRARFPSWC